MVRIWLNHWFSTAYHIIDLIRRGVDGREKDFCIIGTNERPDAVYGTVCDEFYTEPVLPPEEYADYCLGFCKEHGIDVFLPRRGMAGVSRRMADFEAAGVKVMADSYDKISALSSKTAAYELFAGLGIGSVPEYRTVKDVGSFAEACAELRERYGSVCFKKVIDEGGMSFRLIDDSRKGYDALFNPSRTRITLDDAVAALSERETIPELIVMPYLSGHEVSVDALATPSGVIMLPREKSWSRTETVRFDPYILSVCGRFYEKFGLECPCNIQFKYLGDTPYFLEVNTRMSGGVQLSCAACGVNIPNIAVNKLLGKDIPWSYEKTERRVSFVETPVVL